MNQKPSSLLKFASQSHHFQTVGRGFAGAFANAMKISQDIGKVWKDELNKKNESYIQLQIKPEKERIYLTNQTG